MHLFCLFGEYYTVDSQKDRKVSESHPPSDLVGRHSSTFFSPLWHGRNFETQETADVGPCILVHRFHTIDPMKAGLMAIQTGCTKTFKDDYLRKDLIRLVWFILGQFGISGCIPACMSIPCSKLFIPLVCKSCVDCDYTFQVWVVDYNHPRMPINCIYGLHQVTSPFELLRFFSSHLPRLLASPQQPSPWLRCFWATEALQEAAIATQVCCFKECQGGPQIARGLEVGLKCWGM